MELSAQGQEFCVLGGFNVALYPSVPYLQLLITSPVIMHVNVCYRQSAISGEWRKRLYERKYIPLMKVSGVGQQL